MQFIENKPFDDIALGDSAELTRTLNFEDVERFGVLSDDSGPAGSVAERGETSAANSLWGSALISAVIGTELPGPGTKFLIQSLKFLRPPAVGDTLTARVTVIEKMDSGKRLRLGCVCLNRNQETVIEGEAEVAAPVEKIRRPRVRLPERHLHERAAQYARLIAATRDLEPVRTAVVHPCDAVSLAGALHAKSEGIIKPILIGPRSKIEQAAALAERDLDEVDIVDVMHSHAAADEAVKWVRSGRAEAIMKGSLHTDELMAAVLKREGGLRTERRVSHVYVLDVPHHDKPILITDAAINIAPDLTAKRDIVQNAIDLAHALGISQPKVAILSAVETVSRQLPSTIEAAALCKMADRGQITGALVDGPLAFDNAVSKTAAATKSIASAVAGDADVLVAPDLEAANMLAKQLIYLAGADAAGIALGARVPIILTSRADGDLARLASSALAQLFVHSSGPSRP